MKICDKCGNGMTLKGTIKDEKYWYRRYECLHCHYIKDTKFKALK